MQLDLLTGGPSPYRESRASKTWDLAKRRKYMRQYYAANKEKWRLSATSYEKQKEKKRQFYAANREKIREAARQSHAANPEKRRAYSRKDYAANREKRNESARKWQAANQEKIREYRVANRERRQETERKWRIANAEKAKKKNRRHGLRRHYGLTVDQWNALFESQGRRCAICGIIEPKGDRRWHTDHDHSTGKIRGILCRSCNIMLGMSGDNPGVLSKAAEYLSRRPVPELLVDPTHRGEACQRAHDPRNPIGAIAAVVADDVCDQHCSEEYAEAFADQRTAHRERREQR